MGLKVTTKVKYSGVASGAKFSKVVNGKQETEIIETHETDYDSDSRLRQELTQKNNMEYMTVFEILEKKVEHVEDKKVEAASPPAPTQPEVPPVVDQTAQTQQTAVADPNVKVESENQVAGQNAVDGVHADAGTSDNGLQVQADADPKTEVVQESSAPAETAQQTEAAPTETVVQAQDQQDAGAGVGSEATESQNKPQDQV